MEILGQGIVGWTLEASAYPEVGQLLGVKVSDRIHCDPVLGLPSAHTQ